LVINEHLTHHHDAVPAADDEPFDNMPPVDESASLMYDEETNEWSYANETSALTYDDDDCFYYFQK